MFVYLKVVEEKVGKSEFQSSSSWLFFDPFIFGMHRLEVWKPRQTPQYLEIVFPAIWDSGMSVHRHYVHGRWSRHVDQTDINMVWLSNMSNMYN